MVILTTDIKCLEYLHEMLKYDTDDSSYLRALNCKEEYILCHKNDKAGCGKELGG